MNESQNSSIPPNQELLTTFEQLPTAQKVELFEDVVCLLSQDLSRFNEPVLERETDILDGIVMNIQGRLEELTAIYGVK